MILTEKEAKEKFCPNFLDVRCPGSECMAWRWAGYRPVPGKTAPGGEQQDEAHGYCGLAGKPEAER